MLSGCPLISAFFLPRTTLLFLWFMDAMPANNTTFELDVVFAIIAPRALIAWWLYEAGAHPLLVGLFVITEITSRIGAAVRYNEGRQSSAERRRRDSKSGFRDSFR